MTRYAMLVVLLLGLFATPPAWAGEKGVTSQETSIKREQVDVVLHALPDMKFQFGDEVVNERTLRPLLYRERKHGKVETVLIEGEGVTVGHLLVAAQLAKKMRFTLLSESESGLKTVSIAK
jgi:hypothetical protein